MEEIELIEEVTEQEIVLDDENIEITVNYDYDELINKPQINGVELVGNKTTSDLGIDQDFVKDDNYVHTDNNYTTEEKTKLSGLENYDDTEIRDLIEDKVDKVEGKGLSTNDYTDEEKEKLSGLENYDDTQVRNAINDLETNKADRTDIPTKTSQLSNDSGFITKTVNNLTNYTLKTATGSLIDLEINQETYVVTLKLKDQDGNIISTDTIDLPLENVVVNGSYDSVNKKIVLTLENGNTVEFSVADLVVGLQSEITSSNKLDSDLVDDTNSGNKFVTTSEKQTWNNKLDESVLTDYVKNTDYGTANKAGVLKQSNWFNIGTTGFPYAFTGTYAQYENANGGYFIGKGTLENVITGKELINQTQLEESQDIQDEEIEKLKADHPPINETGTELILNGTGDFELALSPKGNITQETGTSPNLLNFPNSTNTQGNVTRVIENGIITLNGTPDNVGYNDRIYTYTVTETGTYTLLPFKNSTNANIRLLYKINNGPFVSDDANPQISLTSGDSLDIHLRIDSTNRIDNFVLKPMLYKGTDTKSYEPYGQYPSPSYPSPVKVVDGSYDLLVQNKNLLEYPYANTTKTENGITFTDNGNGTITINGTATTATNFSFETNQFIKAGTYTFSSNNLPSGVTIYAWDNWGTIGGISPYLNSSRTSITVTSTKDIALRTSLGISNGTTVNNFVVEYQLQPGSTALPYALHAQQTKTIDTSPNPLYSQNDYYYKQNGNWYVHNEWGYITLNGTENWVRALSTSNNIARFGITTIDYLKGNDTGEVATFKSNYFKAVSFNTLYDGVSGGISWWWNDNIKQLILSLGDDRSLDDFKTWLSTHNTSVYYPLATPTNTQITNTTLINQLEALSNMTAYQDQTNISQTHNTAQADMRINADTIMSMRYLQSEIEELKQAIISLGGNI